VVDGGLTGRRGFLRPERIIDVGDREEEGRGARGAIVDHAEQGCSRGELEVRIAHKLLEGAKAESASLVGQGGLLSRVTRQAAGVRPVLRPQCS
jgi:hypothetical protein